MKYDVLVLGAGMVGVSAALELQKRGRKTVLIDRRPAAEETSYGNAGIIQREGVMPYPFPRDLKKICAKEGITGLTAVPPLWFQLAELDWSDGAGETLRYFAEQGYTNIRAIDRKPLPDWYLRVPGVESISADLSVEANAIDAVKGAVEVYNLAADMGGMGFIERFRVECLRSILINTHLIEEAYKAGV